MTDANVVPLHDRPKAVADPTIEENLETITGQVRKLREELAEAHQDLHEATVHAAELADALEDRGRQDIHDHDAAVTLFEDIHRDAGHSGPWTLCSDRLCRRLEEWTHRRRQEMET